ncbi:rod-binding protein [Ideonella azotifigens]|uniref:Flagellar protein FlgJ N-terminal domain-containing protein n=1 Tax=Ideonella azotifigens TaxID=513160 RepID=A0ABN1K982_9BURK|nr:rod-binding protein [Ideonella azotifigens]MCD2339091.1 rod-binding protein [Ideonella azotifigens]
MPMLPIHPTTDLALPDSFAAAVKPARPDPMQAAAKQAAQQFESHFIGQMLHDMRRSSRVLSDEKETERSGEDMLDMADTMVADQLATQGAFGIADLMLRQVMPSAASSFKSALPPVASSEDKP